MRTEYQKDSISFSINQHAKWKRGWIFTAGAEKKRGKKATTFNLFKLFCQQEQIGLLANEIREFWRGQDGLMPSQPVYLKLEINTVTAFGFESKCIFQFWGFQRC